jgi:hypothetical protein
MSLSLFIIILFVKNKILIMMSRKPIKSTAVSDPTSLPSSIKPVTSVLTYVFKEGSPKIQVLLNYIKNKNSGILVNLFTDKNGYTTVTSTTNQFAATDDGCSSACIVSDL